MNSEPVKDSSPGQTKPVTPGPDTAEIKNVDSDTIIDLKAESVSKVKAANNPEQVFKVKQLGFHLNGVNDLYLASSSEYSTTLRDAIIKIVKDRCSNDSSASIKIDFAKKGIAMQIVPLKPDSNEALKLDEPLEVVARAKFALVEGDIRLLKVYNQNGKENLLGNFLRPVHLTEQRRIRDHNRHLKELVLGGLKEFTGFLTSDDLNARRMDNDHTAEVFTKLKIVEDALSILVNSEYALQKSQGKDQKSGWAIAMVDKVAPEIQKIGSSSPYVDSIAMIFNIRSSSYRSLAESSLKTFLQSCAGVSSLTPMFGNKEAKLKARVKPFAKAVLSSWGS